MSVKHVLVVDDSKSARFMLRKILGKINLTADLAESGEEALEYLSNNQPDAIFMDHMMPGLNGLETVKKIKNDSQLASIPIVMYTSQDSEEYKKNVFSCGVVDILSKPASPDSLNHIVRKLNDLPEIPAVQTYVESGTAIQEQASISAEEIEKIVRQTAEAAVSAAVRYQVIGTTAQQLSKFRNEHNFCDENKAKTISEEIFDVRIKSALNEMTSQIKKQVLELTLKLDEIANHKVSKIDPQTLEEIKSVAGLASTNKAIQAAHDTANTVAHDSLIRLTDAMNESNKKMATRITIATVIASSIGVLSAIYVYMTLA
jgi:CheY-like chemotaxis protein